MTVSFWKSRVSSRLYMSWKIESFKLVIICDIKESISSFILEKTCSRVKMFTEINMWKMHVLSRSQEN